MSIKKWISLIMDKRWELMVGLSILFFLVLIIFYKPISAWLRDKEEFNFFARHTWDRSDKRGAPIKKKNETRCREIMESIFQRPFPSVRPSFLKRSNGYALELDGYNKDLKLAFEYQGVQHYKYSPDRFHKSIKDYEEQVQRDNDKRHLCKKAGITVVYIPYTVKYQNLESYIRKELRDLGII